MSGDQSMGGVNDNQNNVVPFLKGDEEDVEPSNVDRRRGCSTAKILFVIGTIFLFLTIIFHVSFSLGLSTRRCFTQMEKGDKTVLDDDGFGTTSPITDEDFTINVTLVGYDNNTSSPAPSTDGQTSTEQQEINNFNSTFDQILRQYQEVEALGCRPTQRKVSVVDLLDPEDNVVKEDVYPKWVVVTKCYQDCTFCPGENEKCLPAAGGEREKSVTVGVGDADLDTDFRTLVLIEHDSCECQ